MHTFITNIERDKLLFYVVFKLYLWKYEKCVSTRSHFSNVYYKNKFYNKSILFIYYDFINDINNNLFIFVRICLIVRIRKNVKKIVL